MLIRDGKVYRNLEEQVLKNQDDITTLSEEVSTMVQANPAVEPSTDLETIKIGDVVYNIPGQQGGAWGEITGNISDQTDLQNALNAKQNVIDSSHKLPASNVSGLAEVATSGAYGDLTNKPDLSIYAQSSSLATVATTGNYDDLNNKPVIPVVSYPVTDVQVDGTSVLNGTIAEITMPTINYPVTSVQVNGSSVMDGTVAKVTVPTDTGDLTNNAGFITSSALNGLATETWVGNQGYLTGITSSDVTTALGYTPVQPSDISHMVTDNTEQTITGDKTFSGKLNKNSSGYGVIMPSTIGNTQNKVLATTDQIKDVYQHYITFTANGGSTVVATKLLTQGNTPMLAADFAQYIYDAFADNTGGLEATGTVELSSVDHKYVGKIGRGSSNTNITIYSVVSTGGYGNTLTLAVSNMANFVDIVERVGSHGGGASGGSITGQDVISALGYVPSHVDPNPATTTAYISTIGIDGVNYAIGAGTVAWNDVTGKPTFATVATSGSYNDLTNKPTIPAAQVNSDWNAVSGVAQILNKPTLSTVATTGSYSDLSNKPDLSIYAQSANLSTVATSGSYADLSNKPDLSIYAQSADLATVATSGSYNDLTDKPTIPVVDYPVTDVQVNGTSVLNGTVAEINVPSVPVQDVTVGGVSVLSGTTAVIPAIPDAVSGTNDGTNWTSLTIGSSTYAIPAGGGGGGSYTAGSGIDITGSVISLEYPSIIILGAND